MFCIYFNPKYGATDLAYSTCGKYDFIGKTSLHSQTGQLIRLNLYQKKKFSFMFKLKALSYSKFFHKLTVTPHSRSHRPRQNLSRSLSRMKEALPCQSFSLKLSRYSLRGDAFSSHSFVWVQSTVEDGRGLSFCCEKPQQLGRGGWTREIGSMSAIPRQITFRRGTWGDSESGNWPP